MKLIEPPIQTKKAVAEILILDDDKFILDSLGEFLTMEGYQVFGAGEFEEAKRILTEQSIQIVITDLNMPNITGLEFLRYVRSHFPQAVVMVITAFGSIESAVDAIKLGAYDYLTKPIIDDELRMSIERALHQQALQAENLALKKQLKQQNEFCEMVGRDHQMQKVFELVEAVASTSTTVLVTGESGTGKTLVAHAIHQRSPRREGPFVEVSCGA
jgi:two-component system, NtrC family, response regulator AtoC